VTIEPAAEPSPAYESADGLQIDLDRTFEIFCQENMWRLRNFLRSQCRDWDLVDDVVQETLLTTRDAWYKINSYDKPLAWVYQTARYKLRKHRDQVARTRGTDIDELSPDRFAEPTDAREAHEMVLGLLGRIPLRQAQVMLLAVQGWNEQEIAVILGIARNTVRTYKREARHRLQELISQDQQRESGGGSES
jgi:RNA polymerase sigma factor (sigma-70 family)